MHVVNDEWGQVGGDYAKIQEAAGARLLDEAVRSVREFTPGCPVKAQLVHGSVAWSLARGLAAEDLVVVGTHKTGYLRGRVIGTRSIVVVSVATCSVAVIPDVDLSGRHGVVVGVASGDIWPEAVRVGVREAARLGQDLALIHAGADLANATSGRSRDLMRAASSLAAETGLAANIRQRISPQRPADALLDASHAASLLVLGASRRNPDRAGYIGWVIHEVLLNINAPVLVSR